MEMFLQMNVLVESVLFSVFSDF